MGPHTERTVFDTILGIMAVSATVLAEWIQGTVAEKTVEFRFINSLMTGKVLAITVLKKSMVVHGSLRKIVCNPMGLCYNGKQR